MRHRARAGQSLCPSCAVWSPDPGGGVGRRGWTSLLPKIASCRDNSGAQGACVSLWSPTWATVLAARCEAFLWGRRSLHF